MEWKKNLYRSKKKQKIVHATYNIFVLQQPTKDILEVDIDSSDIDLDDINADIA